MSFLSIHKDDDVKVCRVCLAVDVKMHNLHTDPLKTTFESIIGMSVMSIIIQLPMFLCFECAGLVRKFSQFKKRCLKGQAILLGFLQNGVQLSQQVIQNIDRKELLLNSPCITTNIENIEYNPLYDNYIEMQTKKDHKVKDEPIIPPNCVIEVDSLDDIQCQKLDDAYQNLTHSSDEELLNSKMENKEQEPTKKIQQEYLKILSEDFIENLMKSDLESSSICKSDQTKKSGVVEERNSDKYMEANGKPARNSVKYMGTTAKPPRKSTMSMGTNAKPQGNSAKFMGTNIKLLRNNAKYMRTNAKPPRTSAKSLRSSAKSIRNNAKPPRKNAKPPRKSVLSMKTNAKLTATVESPITSAKSLNASAECPTARVESPITSLESLTTSAKSPIASVESPTASVKSPTASVESPTASTEFPPTRVESPATDSKSRITSSNSPRINTKSPKINAKSPRINAKSPRTGSKSLTTILKSPKTADTGRGPNSGDDIDLVEYEVIDLTLGQQFEEIEKRKVSENYLHSPFKCEQCYRGFVDTSTFNNHSKKHDPSTGDLECEICKFRFPTKRKFQQHTTHHMKKYACKGCSYVCSNVSSAKLHQRWHKGVLYKCEICGKISSRQNSHLTHMRKLHPSQHICDICGYSFVSKQGVIQHKGIMHKDVVAKDAKGDQESGHSGSYCEKCDVRFVSLEAYDRHMVTSAKHSLNFVGGCQLCGARFSSKEDLREHRRQRHPGQRNHFGGYTTRKKYHYPKKKPSRTWPAKCEHCPEEISNARDYWTHFRRAHPDLPYPIRKDYVCDICGKGFRGNAFLTYHKRTHSSDRLFSCVTCDKSFYNRMNLAMHERTHSDAHPHHCKLCSKVFKFRSNLTRHYRIHNGEKPYECEICGKAFSQSNSRNVHIRTVHLKEPPPYLSKARLEKKKLSKKNNN